MNQIALGAVLFLLTVVGSNVGVSFIRRWALRRSIFAIRSDHSSHIGDKPLGGGLAIIFTSVTAWVIYLAVVGPREWRTVAAFLIGAGFVATISWKDDLRSQPWPLRIGMHSLGAAVFVIGVGSFQQIDVPLVGYVDL